MKSENTLGAYLVESEPVPTLWRDLVDVVYRDSPERACTERLSCSACTLFDTGFFFGELVNGGMSQFFSNSSGNRTHETLAALREIGATLCVTLLEKALTVFPDSKVPVDRRRRCELLFAFEEKSPMFLQELDQVFYACVDALGAIPQEDLALLELEYLRAHGSDPVVV